MSLSFHTKKIQSLRTHPLEFSSYSIFTSDSTVFIIQSRFSDSSMYCIGTSNVWSFQFSPPETNVFDSYTRLAFSDCIMDRNLSSSADLYSQFSKRNTHYLFQRESRLLDEIWMAVYNNNRMCF